MKVVTYNVNGLRPRVSQFGSLRRLLASLNADIICFQETKLSKQDLSADLTMVEGYEAFFSCSRVANKGRGGYSGVATFCRVKSAFSSNEVSLPIAATEGITGIHENEGNQDNSKCFVLEYPFEAEGLDNVTKEELLSVDAEGRCVITDHEHFVLFNIYGPRAEDDNKERVRFKLLFFKILQKRWEHLLDHGRRVFVVGDLNIAPYAIDRCDAEPGFERQMFRQLLRSMLRVCGGPFFDVFRSLHPERTGAYTCFNQRIGGEVYNFGSRIDHILISGPCFHHSVCLDGHDIVSCHVEECGIMDEYKRGHSDNKPKWKGGREFKVEGSDHIPVYAIFNTIPDVPVHNTPPLAARYLPELRGRQQSIVSFVAKGKISKSTDSTCQDIATAFTDGKDKCHDAILSEDDNNFVGNFVARHLCENEISSSSGNGEVESSMPLERGRESSYNIVKNKRGRDVASSQLSIKSFFKLPRSFLECDVSNHIDDCSTAAADVERVDKVHNAVLICNEGLTASAECSSVSAVNDLANSNIRHEDCLDPSCTPELQNSGTAVLDWQRIHQKMKMSKPLCRGHHEPCIPRSVKKGANIGRLFYVCARAQGPTSNPEANCGHFQWASSKPKERHK